MTLANHLFVNKFLFNLCKLYIFTEVYERIEKCFFLYLSKVMWIVW